MIVIIMMMEKTGTSRKFRVRELTDWCEVIVTAMKEKSTMNRRSTNSKGIIEETGVPGGFGGRCKVIAKLVSLCLNSPELLNAIQQAKKQEHVVGNNECWFV